MDNDQSLREHVVNLLQGGQAYDDFDTILAGFPAHLRGIVPPGAERSVWQILEHMQITQRDILDFCQNEHEDYVELNWPGDYWPVDAAPADDEAWHLTINGYLADRVVLESLVHDPQCDLFTPFPWGEGQTLLREALLAADHASYHLGQIVVVRRLLGA